MYWKNGTEVDLSGNNSQTFGIAYVSGDAYVSGNGGYWVNGTFTPMQDASFINSIFTSGSDVYAIGSLIPGASPAAYWKNGIVNQFEVEFSVAEKMVILNNDVYLAGQKYDQG